MHKTVHFKLKIYTTIFPHSCVSHHCTNSLIAGSSVRETVRESGEQANDLLRFVW